MFEMVGVIASFNFGLLERGVISTIHVCISLFNGIQPTHQQNHGCPIPQYAHKNWEKRIYDILNVTLNDEKTVIESVLSNVTGLYIV